MEGLDRLVEERIRQAIARGDLDGLPGAGRALVLDDDSGVPEELRMAYRVLRNAGVAPQEVQLLRGIRELEAAADGLDDARARALALGRLALMRTRFEACRGVRGRGRRAPPPSQGSGLPSLAGGR